MGNLIDAAIHHTRTGLSIFILLLIAGWVTYQNIPKEANPKFDAAAESLAIEKAKAKKASKKRQ
jgi:multidrug efflux pump subunit AcrB